MQDRPSSHADKLHLEDFEIGKAVSFGRKQVTKEEIVAFAEAYDPQRIHLDEEYAKASIVGGLCASGFHSCAILMRMMADEVLNKATSQGSPGMDEVRWLKPVRPGDVLTGRYTCKERRALASRPEVGLAKMKLEMLNQDGAVVMTWDSNQLLSVRAPHRPSDGSAVPARSERPPPLQSLWEMPLGPAPSATSNYFEDRVIGEMTDLGAYTFAKDESIAFARDYDPQPFHIDEASAKSSIFGALCASGWHTAAIYIRQSVAVRRKIEAAITANWGKLAAYGPSPGFKDVRWLKPVYPGDTLSFRNRIADKVDLRSRPDRGLLMTHAQARNQHGDIVFAIMGQILVERREPYAV